MGDIRGFLKHTRALPNRRPVPVRLKDWKEVYEPFPEDEARIQASRCMDCGIPFCSQGCPLGNLIPDWNDLVYRGNWREASDRLHATNNFPEFTGRLCPAPCEAACVLGISQPPVTIEQMEKEIAERAWADGLLPPVMAATSTGKRVAVVGSGPAGLATAQQLTRAGHAVVVFERDDRIGGLLRYGIPEFKMEKWVIDRRLDQMRAEGTEFRTSVDAGDPESGVTGESLLADFDAVVLAVGSTQRRDLPVPGRELDGIHQAMDFLPPANRVQFGDLHEHPFSAKGRKVVIIGGGDTGADCLGTVHRHGAASVHQFEIMSRPPDRRSDVTPWPMWPLIYRVAAAHEEGGERVYSVNTERFLGDDDGRVRALVGHEVELVDGHFERVDGTDFEIETDLVLLAMGFTGPERLPLYDQLGVDFDQRGNIARDASWATNVPGIYVAGDAGRGQSLIVWAIAEGRSCAASVDASLMGGTLLPSPVCPTDRPL
ncbi:MAG: glutamate synthase subunit beta [Acidimicrobiales bacterium]